MHGFVSAFTIKLLYAPFSLKIKNIFIFFFPQNVTLYIFRIILHINKINRLVFVMEKLCAFYEMGIQYLVSFTLLSSLKLLTKVRTFPVFRSVRKIAKSDYQLRHVCPSVLPSAWNDTAPTGRIFMKFDILSVFFDNLSRKFKFH
jgi:hypothetical protein